MNSFLILIIGGTLAAILYTLANFSIKQSDKRSLGIILLISIAFAVSEYLIKVPTWRAVRNQLSPISIQLFWIGITFLTVLIFQLLFLKEKIPTHTYIFSAIILISVAANLFLSKKES